MDKSPLANGRDMRSIPGPRRPPRASEQLSQCTTTTEARTPYSLCSAMRYATSGCSSGPTVNSSPCSLQLEKVCVATKTHSSQKQEGLLDVSVREAPWPGEVLSEGVKGWSPWGKLKKQSEETHDKGKYLQPLCKGQIFLKCKSLLEFYRENTKAQYKNEQRLESAHRKWNSRKTWIFAQLQFAKREMQITRS